MKSNVISHRFLAAAVLMTGALLTCSSAAAQPGFVSPANAYYPPQPVNPSNPPRLGIMGHMLFGQGMSVDSVFPGSLAQRVGLEPGDLIIAVNNTPVQSHQQLQTALQYSGGTIRIFVRDVRTGQTMWTQPATLDNGSGNSGIFSPIPDPSVPAFNGNASYPSYPGNNVPNNPYPVPPSGFGSDAATYFSLINTNP